MAKKKHKRKGKTPKGKGSGKKKRKKDVSSIDIRAIQDLGVAPPKKTDDNHADDAKPVKLSKNLLRLKFMDRKISSNNATSNPHNPPTNSLEQETQQNPNASHRKISMVCKNGKSGNIRKTLRIINAGSKESRIAALVRRSAMNGRSGRRSFQNFNPTLNSNQSSANVVDRMIGERDSLTVDELATIQSRNTFNVG